MGRKITDDKRKQIAQLLDAGKTAPEVAKEIGVVLSTVYKVAHDEISTTGKVRDMITAGKSVDEIKTATGMTASQIAAAVQGVEPPQKKAEMEQNNEDIPPEQSDTADDPVDHPDHYQLPGMDAEAIDVIRAVLGDGFRAYCRGCELKYLIRADKSEEETCDGTSLNCKMRGGTEELCRNCTLYHPKREVEK